MSVEIRPLVDQALNGRLTEILADARAEGFAYERIARMLATEHGIEVSKEQVRVWCLDSGIVKPEKAA